MALRLYTRCGFHCSRSTFLWGADRGWLPRITATDRCLELKICTLHTRRHTTHNHSIRPFRYYSSSQPKNSGGFFRNVIENIRKGYEKDKALQESLKSFREEREKLEKSNALNTMKEGLSNAWRRSVEVSLQGWEAVRKGWERGIEQLSNVYKKASDTTVGKKSQDVGSQIYKTTQKTVEQVSEQVSKTNTYKTVSKGATVVKEDLLDDIIKESAPYQSPDTLKKRAELTPDHKEEHPATQIEPDEVTKDVVVTKQSRWDRWSRQWTDLRQNNPITNTFYTAKMRYDESDNIIIRASRAVTDRVGDAVGGTMTQSEMAQTMAEIRKVDPKFIKEDFVKQCQFEIIPTVLDAFLKGNLEVLQDWCHEAAFNLLAAVIKQRIEPGTQIVDCKVLDVSNVDIVMAKVMDQGPVMVLVFEAQQLTVKRTAGVDEEVLENIFYVWALCRDQTVYNPKASWRVLEFGIQSAGKLLV